MEREFHREWLAVELGTVGFHRDAEFASLEPKTCGNYNPHRPPPPWQFFIRQLLPMLEAIHPLGEARS